MTEEKEVGGEYPKDDANDAGGASGGKDSQKDDMPLVDRPGFQKLVAALLVLITVTICSAMFVLVVEAVNGGSSGDSDGAWHTAFFTVLIGLFGVLITGLFVFMAFRIDRGAKWEAQQVAKKAAKGVVKKARSTARKRAGKVAAKKAAKVAAKAALKATAEKFEQMANNFANQFK